MFSTKPALNQIPTNSVQGFSFPHFLANIWFCVLFYESHSDRCEVIPHCGFDFLICISMKRSNVKHVPVGHLHDPFGKMSTQVFCPSCNMVVFLTLSCMNCLYILDISPLLLISFANNFYLSWSPFGFVMVSFVVQKLLSLISSHLFLFLFLLL